MHQEYPSTEDEPFSASNEDKFFGRQLDDAEREGRINDFGIASTPVHCFWDLGRDGMPVWFMQEVHGEPRFIDVLFSKGSTVTETAAEIAKNPTWLRITGFHMTDETKAPSQRKTLTQS